MGLDKSTTQHWMVLRTDDNGVCVLVIDHLLEVQAKAVEREMTARGHKQSFSVIGYSPDQRAETILLHRIQE